MPAERKRKPRQHFDRKAFYDSHGHVDAELLIQAEELAANRENTSVPGRAAVKKALRDLLDERRRRDARAEALAATGWSDDRGSDDESDGAGGRDVLDDWSFPEE